MIGVLLYTTLMVLAAAAYLANVPPPGWHKLLKIVERFLERMRVLHIIAPLLSYLLFAQGFLRNLILHKNDSSAFEKQKEIIRKIGDYAVSSGCYDELWSGIFHWNFLTSLIILSRIHKRLHLSTEAEERLGEDLSANDSGVWEESARMLRYSCAIYGHDVVSAGETQFDEDKGVLSPFFHHERRRYSRVLGQLTGVIGSDILVRNWQDGGSTEYASHTVVLDHRHRKIIFAIRGCLSFSDFLRAIQVYPVPFYGGSAHAGFAELAIATWKKATTCSPEGDFLTIAPDDYELVFTGHSVGGSVAMLITIMVLREKLVKRPVRCVVFGPFAPFYQLGCIEDILPRITAFVHGYDLFPFDSVQQLRILNESLAVINQERRNMRYVDVLKLAFGNKELPQHMVQAVADVPSTLKPALMDTPLFTIPAGQTIWLRGSTTSGVVVLDLCARTMQEMKPLVVCSSMMSDHTPDKYQAVFQKLTGRSQFRKSVLEACADSVTSWVADIAAEVAENRESRSSDCAGVLEDSDGTAVAAAAVDDIAAADIATAGMDLAA